MDEPVTFGRAAPTICVRDMQAALRFYGGVLGFATDFQNGDPVGFAVYAAVSVAVRLRRGGGAGWSRGR